jgi:hypothetical protein
MHRSCLIKGRQSWPQIEVSSIQGTDASEVADGMSQGDQLHLVPELLLKDATQELSSPIVPNTANYRRPPILSDKLLVNMVSHTSQGFWIDVKVPKVNCGDL